MTNSTRPLPSRREIVGSAREVIAAPEQHSRFRVWDACEALIHFGTENDLATVSALREKIEAGAIKFRPDVQAKPRPDLQRWIKIAVAVLIVIWALAWSLGAIADAQAAGVLPSVAEIVQ